MAATMKIISILAFLCLISQCYSQCSLSDVWVSQSETGAEVLGKPEWSVSIINKCPCVQKNVILNCTGFQTVQEINPSILTVSNGQCLVQGGEPICKGAFTFSYAWDTSLPFTPIHSDIDCP